MPSAPKQAPAIGAYCSLAELIEQRYPARQLDLGQRKRALSMLSGPNKTNFRGRGIDFEEVRAYQPGDDIRTIDWRVTARTGTAHTKMFREERERQVLVCVDQRSGMFFGSRFCCKSVLAARLAALLSWAALQRGDRLGGLVFSETEHREVRPKRSRRSVLGLLRSLTELNNALPGPAPDSSRSFTDMLVELRRIARPGSSVFIVSDFGGSLTEASLEQIYSLARHLEITALHCSDPMEQELPSSGGYVVTDGESRAKLFTGENRLRESYAARYQHKLTSLRQALGKLGIPMIEASTTDSPLGVLLAYYAGTTRR